MRASMPCSPTTRSPAQRLLTGWVDDGLHAVSGLHRFRRRLDASERAVAPVGTRKVTYTSGSTSNPKGVCLSGAALDAIAAAVADATRVLPIARHLCVLPLATLLENVAGLYAPLLRGATCVLPPSRVRHELRRSRRRPPARDADARTAAQPDPRAGTAAVARHRGRARLEVPGSLQFVAVGGAKVARRCSHAPRRRAFPFTKAMASVNARRSSA